MSRQHVIDAAFRALLLAAALALSACGGAGLTIASLPGPAAATSSSSAASSAQPTYLSTSVEKLAPLGERAGLTEGNYALKAASVEEAGGVKTTQFLADGQASLGVNAATRTYTLTIGAAGFPAGQSFDLGHSPAGAETGFGYHIIKTDHFSDGSTQVKELDADRGICCEPIIVPIGNGKVDVTTFYLDLRQSYVSLGGWSHSIADAVANQPNSWLPNATGPNKSVVFAQGIRTDPASLPVSGTASYTSNGGALSFVADFLSRSITGTIAVTPYKDPEESYWDRTGISATGSAAIRSAGDFLIPLSGQFFEPTGAPKGKLTGSIDGAFFGPQAVEIGGVYQLLRDGLPWTTQAFAGTKTPSPPPPGP